MRHRNERENTMKTGGNLQEVLVELNRQNQAKQDFISPAQGMHLREDGHTFEINHLTTSQQEVFGTTSLFHRQVAGVLCNSYCATGSNRKMVAVCTLSSDFLYYIYVLANTHSKS